MSLITRQKAPSPFHFQRSWREEGNVDDSSSPESSRWKQHWEASCWHSPCKGRVIVRERRGVLSAGWRTAWGQATLLCCCGVCFLRLAFSLRLRTVSIRVLWNNPMYTCDSIWIQIYKFVGGRFILWSRFMQLCCLASLCPGELRQGGRSGEDYVAIWVWIRSLRWQALRLEIQTGSWPCSLGLSP